MNLSVEKLLIDADNLVVHLRSHDTVANSIIAATQTLYNKTEAMKQYQEDISELNEIAKYRPRSSLLLGLAQENYHIRELQQENREMQAALEEHQSALELIMQKYREHTSKLLQSNKIEQVIQEQEIDKDSVCQLMDKIDEMAGVMQKAIEVDERLGRADEEHQSRLEVENRALRELLEICTTSKSRILTTEMQNGKGNVEGSSEGEDDKSDTECDSLVVMSHHEREEEKKESEESKLKGQADLNSDSFPSAELNSSDILSVTIMDAILRSSKVVLLPESAKSLGESKSAGDIRKGKTILAEKVESKFSVTKTMSSTSLKRDLK